MDIEEIIYKRRTIRRFKQKPVSIEIVKKLVDFARLAPMGNNIQCLEYIIVLNDRFRERLFPMLSWAGSLPKEDRIPEVDRRPMAYLVVLVNTKIKKNADFELGGAIENILLGAVKFGLGSCWMGAIDRNKIKELFKISNEYSIRNVISLGYPDEKSVVEPFIDSFKYWKDEADVMHIPKRSLDDIILNIF